MFLGFGALVTPFLNWFMRLVGKEIEKKVDGKKKKPKSKPIPKPSKTPEEVLAESRERTRNNKPDVGEPVELDPNPYEEDPQ